MLFFHEISIILRLFFLSLFYSFELFAKNFLIPAFLSQKLIKDDIILITGAGMYIFDQKFFDKIYVI